jgi:predicted transcriptional regulator
MKIDMNLKGECNRVLNIVICKLLLRPKMGYSQMGRMRKGAVQIRFEILEFLFFNAKPQLRTSVWRKSTNLSYDDFLKHLTFLKDKKLVKETEDGCYILAEEGIKLYLELHRSLPSIL